MKNFLLAMGISILVAVTLFMTIVCIQNNYNPVEIGDAYIEEITDNPFTTQIPDTAIVLDKKNGWVKYKVIYHSDNTYVGRRIYETSTEELAFKSKFSNKIENK